MTDNNFAGDTVQSILGKIIGRMIDEKTNKKNNTAPCDIFIQ